MPEIDRFVLEPLRKRKPGKPRVLRLKTVGTFLRDPQGIGKLPVCVIEKFRHLPRSLEVVLVVRQALELGTGKFLLCLDGNQGAITVGILPFEVMNVVGGDHADTQFASKGQCILVQTVVERREMPLQFQIEIIAVNFAVERSERRRLVMVAGKQRPADTPGVIGGKTNEPVAVLCEPGTVDMRRAVDESFACGARKEYAEIAVSGFVLDEKYQRGRNRGPAVMPCILFEKIDLAADDQPHSGIFCKAEEFRHIEHGGIIRDSDRIHSLAYAGGEKLLGKNRAALH